MVGIFPAYKAESTHVEFIKPESEKANEQVYQYDGYHHHDGYHWQGSSEYPGGY